MSNCCQHGNNKRVCPVNRNKCAAVGMRTILHHLRWPWNRVLKPQQYFYCESPDCDVVYFGEDGSIFTVEDLRGPVGQQQSGKDNKDRMICYCFGVTMTDAENDVAAKTFIMQQTKAGNCSCETSNPAGRCCLKDFPK